MRRGGIIAVVALTLAVTAGVLVPVIAEPSLAPTPVAKPGTATLATPQPQAAQPGPDPIGALMARQTMPVVLSTHLGETTERTRFVVELSDPVQVRVFTLTNPNRVVIDMPEVLWHSSGDARPSGNGPVQSYRYGLYRKGNSRFVIDLGEPVRVDRPRIDPPEGASAYHLVIDLYPTSDAAFAAHSGWPQQQHPAGTSVAALPPAAAPALPTPQQAPAGKRMIVVDAGHGGIDPGTHGATGLQEKDIVLAVAKRLRETLEGTGQYKVALTRDTDTFIPLGDRVKIARAAHGDLFVSLHIDFNEHHEVRGASIYTLSDKGSDEAAAKLAARENMSDVIAGVDLSGENGPVASILIDLAQRDTMNRSARFAETVLGTLRTATMVRPISPHKSAAFAVLKGPDIPAVLIELGYLSNGEDEGMMGTDAWRKRVAHAIAAGIDKHFGTAVAGRQAADR